MTVEIATGHLVQNLVKPFKEVENLITNLYNLCADVDNLIALQVLGAHA